MLRDIARRCLGFGSKYLQSNHEMTATVSIILPAYNAALHVECAINSVLSQSIKDWQLIAVNDGSSDKTGDILDKIQDHRIIVVHQENRGASAARNKGLDLAQGEFVTFLDADDRLPPYALEDRVRYFKENSSVDIVNGAVHVTQVGKSVKRYLPSTKIESFFPRIAKLDENVFFGIVYMIRRQAIGSHRFPVGITHCEDLIFFLTLAHDENLTYGAVDSEIYEYCLQDDSAMSNLAGIEDGYLALLRHSFGLERMTETRLNYLRKHIASVLVKSWLRKGRPLRALAAGFCVLKTRAP